MVDLSIEIPVTRGTHLRWVLESIRAQEYQDYEVIVANSSNVPLVADLIQEYGHRQIVADVRLLEARYLAHIHARGMRALLLDETRGLRNGALNVLANVTEDMAVLKETERGIGLLSTLAELDRQSGVNERTEAVDPRRANVLPRYFRASLLAYSFDKIRRSIPADVFRRIIYGDHHLLTWESMLRSSSITVIHRNLLEHVSDSSLSAVAKKYYRYGKSSAALDGTVYSSLMSPGSHMREPVELRNSIASITMLLLRGVPYLAGLYTARVHGRGN